MLRHLRIAAAVFFALLAIGFVALWVTTLDRQLVAFGQLPTNRRLMVQSCAGILKAQVMTERYDLFGNWEIVTWPSSLGVELSPLKRAFFFDANLEVMNIYFTVPHWFLAACSLALAGLFAFNRTWRFSVRTILIATTLVAATLGLGVYLLR